MRLFSRKERGFSLLELLLSIAIISLIILMATRYFSSVRGNQKASETISLLQGMRAGISSLHTTNPSLAITTSILCSYNQIPKSYCDASNNIISPIGSITLGAVSNTFTVTVAGLPDTGTCNSICSAFINDMNVSSSSTYCSTQCTGSTSNISLDLSFNS